MAKQIKKKFIADDAIDGVKLLLEQDQTLRRLLQDGSEQDVIAYLEGLVGAEEARALAAEGVLQDAIDAEQLRAEAAEQANTTAISAEEARALAAEGVLQGNIDAEASARQSADNTLQGNIDAEEAARQAADSTLQGNIDAEASARQSADTTLQSNIDAEESARIAGDASLQSQIDDILSNTDPAALDSLSEIVAEFQSADSDLSSAITAALGTHTSELAAEESARIAADSTLQGNIDAEEARALAAEGVLQGNIDAEEAARQAADADLQSKLDVETVRARSAEEDLQDNIDAEEAARIAADSTEATARAAADTALQGNIDAEASARQSADTALQSNIDAEESARIDGDNALDARMVPMEEILEYQKSVAYEDSAAVYADAAPGREDENLREGWYYSNDGQDGFNKINWYFHDGQKNQVTLGDFSAYAVMTFDDASESPILAVYTFPTGTNDAASWYHSRIVYSGLSATPEVGKQYLVHFGQDPQIHPELPRLELSMSSQNTVGDQNPAEIVMTSSFGTNSVAPVGAVKFLVEHLGVYSPSFKSDVKLKIHHATQQEFDALQSQVDALDGNFATDAELAQAVSDLEAEIDADVLVEKQRAEAAETQLQSNIDQEVSDRQSADSTLQDNIDAEEAARIAAVSAEEARALAAEGALSTRIDDMISNVDPAAIDSFTEVVAAYEAADGNLQTSITNLSTAASDDRAAIRSEFAAADSTLQGNIDAEEAARIAGDDSLQSQIDQINADVSAVVQFDKESFTVSQADLNAGYIDLAAEAKPSSIVMFVDRLAMHEGAVGDVCDYSVSVVGGVTRITFESEMVTPAPEALEVGQVIRVTYAK